MQNTERVVLKTNNQPAFIDKFVDNVAEYLLWLCFLQRATFYLLDQPCRLAGNSGHFQPSAAGVGTPSGMNMGHSARQDLGILDKNPQNAQDYSVSKEKLAYEFRFFQVAITSLYHIKANFTKMRVQVLLASAATSGHCNMMLLEGPGDKDIFILLKPKSTTYPHTGLTQQQPLKPLFS